MSEDLRIIRHNELRTLVQRAFSLSPPSPILIIGRAGIGKSAIIHEFSNSDEFAVFDIRAINMDLGDLITRVPEQDTNSLKNYIAEFLHEINRVAEQGKKVILLLDEFDKANIQVLRMFYQLILDRRVENFKLHDNVLIIAIINTSEDAENTDITAEKPLWDRFVFRVKLETDAESWIEWALQNNIDKRIVAYISRFNSDLYVEDTENDILIATPRRWEFLSRTISDVQDIRELELVAHSVLGVGLGSKFVAFVKHMYLFDIEKMLKEGKVSEEILNDADKQYALASVLSQHSAKAYAKDDAKTFKACNKLALQLNSDVQVIYLRMLVSEVARLLNKTRDEVKEELFLDDDLMKIAEKISKVVM